MGARVACGAQNGPGQGAALVHGGGQPLGHQVLRAVLVHADLLQHHAPLGLHVPLVKAGVEQHVGQDIQADVQVLVQTAGVKTGVLLGGIGVHLAADGVHIPGQLGGGAPLGALEEHVLDKVGRAVLPLALVAGAHPHKKAQSGGAGPGDLLREQPRAVGQSDLLIHNKKPPMGPFTGPSRSA